MDACPRRWFEVAKERNIGELGGLCPAEVRANKKKIKKVPCKISINSGYKKANKRFSTF